MDINSCYKTKLFGHQSELYQTTVIFRSAVELVIPIFNKEWDNGLGLTFKENVLQAKSNADHLIHTTKNNKAPYPEFDETFHHMPSYFRRAVIAQALGAVSSYRSLLQNWNDAGQQGRKPTFNAKRYVAPCFYKGKCGNTSDCESMLITGSNTVKLKLYNGKTWNWYEIPVRQQDVNYLQKHWTGVDASAPSLIRKKRNKYYLSFMFQETVDLKLNDKPLDERKIMAIDLGINTDACCSVMTSDGTILARKFISFGSDKDRLFKCLGRLSKKQSKGLHFSRNEWNRIKRLNTELGRKITSAVVQFAIEQDVQVIVFEFLRFTGKVHGSKKARLHIWRKRGIQKMIEHQAHRNLIRVSHVCAWNTSKLAFDGSGTAERCVALDTQTKKNYSLCQFPEINGKKGKIYNCDLNASYNIGSRYFIREMVRLSPNLEFILPKTPQRTYNDLLKAQAFVQTFPEFFGPTAERWKPATDTETKKDVSKAA